MQQMQGVQNRDRSSDFKNVTPERMQKAEDDRRKYLERNNGVDKHNLAGDIYNFMASMPGDVGHMSNGMPILNFVQHGDNNNAEASMRFGQVAPTRQFEPKQRAGMGYQPRPMAQPAQPPQPPSIDEQMNSPNYQGLLKRREESGGQDADAQRQLDLLQSSFKEQREREGIRTRGPESFDRQSQEQYMPVPLGQPFQIATNDMPSPSFAQPQQFSGGFGSKGGAAPQFGRGYGSGIGGFF